MTVATATADELREAITHLAVDAARMTPADPYWPLKHRQIDRLLTALEATP